MLHSRQIVEFTQEPLKMALNRDKVNFNILKNINILGIIPTI